MATRKPVVAYYWTMLPVAGAPVGTPQPRVNWRLVGGNGEIMCQSTQGFRNKSDARLSVVRVVLALSGGANAGDFAETGPGPRPKDDGL